MSTPNDNTDLERDTTSDTTAISATIPTLDTGTYTESTFTANKWGYSINSNTAIPSTVTSGFIPFTSGNTLMERDTAVNHDEAELSFASKIDYLQPAGAYSTTLQFNIVANPLVYYMQDLNPALCTSTPMTVVDKRDDEEYTIAKLADGNCWLLENLRLDISDPSVQAKLTSATTNATDTTLGYLKNGGGSSPYPGNGVIAKTASGGSWTDYYNNPYIATQYENTTQAASGSSPAGKIGIYYNYCAASAGSYCYAANASSGDTTQDICPAGWRMPTGGASGEYQALFAAYSSNVANFQAALSTPLSGAFGSGAAGNQGVNGYFWSSTRNNSYNMYDLNVNSSTVSPRHSYNRYLGFSVRCVLQKNNINQVTYLQEFDTMPTEEKTIVINSMTTGTSYPIKDSRDNQEYTIAKLPDGNLWMTQNLRYQGDTVGSTSTTTSWIMKSATSNINADKTMTMTDLTAGNTYDAARYHVPTSAEIPSGLTADDIGVWYNYAAASAMTITGSSNTNAQVYDICPKGWRLPTNTEHSGIISYASAYSPVAGGHYYSGTLGNNTENGFWWSSTSDSATNRNCLYWYDSSSLHTGYNSRNYGYYVRCIRSS